MATKSNQPQQETKPAPASGETEKHGEFGEGNYVASRHYNQATEKFVRAGRVEAAAQAAAPRDAKDADAMKQAEDAGRARAKEEDPAVERKPRPERSTKG